MVAITCPGPDGAPASGWPGRPGSAACARPGPARHLSRPSSPPAGPATQHRAGHAELLRQPDTPAQPASVKTCSAQSRGKYTISYQQLPTSADGQRQQLVRRLAAKDNTHRHPGPRRHLGGRVRPGGLVLPWTGTNKQQAENGTLKPALETAIWKGKLYAVPDNSNTQLLWYRSDLVKTPPTTWAQMIADSKQLAKAGKPHLIEIQGAQYEGVTVWFNTMLASAGGSVLTPDAEHVSLGPPRSPHWR